VTLQRGEVVAKPLILCFDDERERAVDLLSGLAEVVIVDVVETLDLVVDALRSTPVSLLLVDMGVETDDHIDLQFGRQVLECARAESADLPIIVYTQFPFDFTTKRLLVHEFELSDVVSKVAPEEKLHRSIEETLCIDLGPARWHLPHDQVLVELVGFDSNSVVTLEIPSWPVGESISVKLGARVFDDFRHEILAAAGSLSEKNPMLFYGQARLDAEDGRKLGLRLNRTAGRYPSLSAASMADRIKVKGDVEDTEFGDLADFFDIE
jgi:hypothetical protein